MERGEKCLRMWLWSDMGYVIGCYIGDHDNELLTLWQRRTVVDMPVDRMVMVDRY